MKKFQLLINYLFWTFSSNKLHLSALQTPFQWGDMVPTLSINVYDSEHCKVIRPNSCFAHILSYTEFAKLSNEALPGGILVPLFPSKKGLVPQKRNLDFLCSLFAKLPVFPLFIGLCSPEKIALVPQNPWEGFSNHQFLMSVVLYRNLNVAVVSEKIRWFFFVCFTIST